MQQNRPSVSPWQERIFSLLLAAQWPELLMHLVHALWTRWQRMQEISMYEALQYESTLELLDVNGEDAIFAKHVHVRYLQNDVIAYQDQIWSDGEAPLDYQCSPGVVVDQYRPAQTTILLISLRERKQRGEEDDYHMQWRIRAGFRRNHELWQTTVHYPIHFACIRVIFPAARPPLEVWGIEEGSRHKHRHRDLTQQLLPDGRWLTQWEVHAPILQERYDLHWRW